MIPRGSSIHKEALGIVEPFPSFSPENIVVIDLPKKRLPEKCKLKLKLHLILST